jgi:DNA gyrase/topoisomerase IV subunit A
MDNILPKLYREYGEYSNWRNFPSSRDGLKPVERRILFSTLQIARNKLTKSARVDGHVIGNYHPHGSVYGSIVQLVRQGFLGGQGNFGCNVGVESIGPAASRYTEVSLLPYTINLLFKNLDFVPWELNYSKDLKEPLYLPTMFPVCLIGNIYTQGIGFGYSTIIPCYKIEDLFKRLQWLIGERKNKPTIQPITDCTITSSKKDLEQLLTTGKSKISVEGVIEEMPRNNTVILKSWPPGKKFESILKKFQKELDSGSIGFSDLSVDTTVIMFKVLRERNRDVIYNNFVKKLKTAIQGSISFVTTVINQNEKVEIKSLDKMLVETYEIYVKSEKDFLTDKINKIQQRIDELKILQIIRPLLSDCLKKQYDIDSTVNEISTKSKIDKKIIQNLFEKYRIKKLLTIDFDTKYLKDESSQIKLKINNLKNHILDGYQELISNKH